MSVTHSHWGLILLSNQYLLQAWHHHYAPKHQVGQWRGMMAAAGLWFCKEGKPRVSREKWEAKSSRWSRAGNTFLSQHPVVEKCEIGSDLLPTCAALPANDASVRADVWTCQSAITRVLGHVWQGNVFFCACPCVIEWMPSWIIEHVCFWTDQQKRWCHSQCHSLHA